MPREGVLAAPEQALCDYVFLCRKRGVAAASLVTFRNLERLDSRVLDATLPRYSATVRHEVAQILGLEQRDIASKGRGSDRVRVLQL